MNPKRVLVFGTFDGLHTGHHFVLRQAKIRGTYLIVAIARDKHVQELKHKIPQHRERVRLEAVQQLPFVDEARLSDEQLGSFAIINEVHPDLIVLGHDQTALEESLREWMQTHHHYLPIQRMKKIEKK
jgi:cytidyltransferase-like protein